VTLPPPDLGELARQPGESDDTWLARVTATMRAHLPAEDGAPGAAPAHAARARVKRPRIWRVSVQTAPRVIPDPGFVTRMDNALAISKPDEVRRDTARHLLLSWYRAAQRGGTCLLQMTAVQLGRMYARGRECARLVRDWAEANGLFDVIAGRVRAVIDGVQRVVNDANVLVFPEAPPPPPPADVTARAAPRHGLRPVYRWALALGLVPRASGWLNATPRPARAPP